MTKARSYLFVPGDSPRKIEKALSSKASAVIVDLEDSVAEAQKDSALKTTCDALAQYESADSRPEIWVRLNPVGRGRTPGDITTLPRKALCGLFIPKLERRAQLDQVGFWLDALEQRDGLVIQQTRLIGIITETPNALTDVALFGLTDGHPRLRGYSWGVEDLSAALNRVPLAGSSAAQATLAQATQLHCVLVAASAEVDAIDAIDPEIHDLDALTKGCNLARELGFVDKMAIHPNQIDSINNSLSPSDQELAWAKQVQKIRREKPAAASFSLNGRMIDQPHFRIAESILNS